MVGGCALPTNSRMAVPARRGWDLRCSSVMQTWCNEQRHSADLLMVTCQPALFHGARGKRVTAFRRNLVSYLDVA